MTELKLEIAYNFFRNEKINEKRQERFKKILIENGFNNLNLEFGDEGELEHFSCYSFTRKEIDGEIQYKDEIDLANDLLKVLKDNDFLNLELIKEYYEEDTLVYVYPTEIEPLYCAGSEELFKDNLIKKKHKNTKIKR